MKKTLFLISAFIMLCSCLSKKQDKESINSQNVTEQEQAATSQEISLTRKEKDVKTFVPSDFIISEKIEGDLNKDGLADCILIIKDTKEENIVKNNFGDIVDRNRRGIIIAFNRGNYYEQIVSNYSCFSSENEEGGVYFAPELWTNINENGSFDVHYGHGRYGYWKYIFRYQNNAFELIGFESHSNRGPVELSIESINFSTKKKKSSINTSEDEDEEIWKDTWEDIKDIDLIDIKDIIDFDNLSFESFYIEQTDN